MYKKRGGRTDAKAHVRTDRRVDRRTTVDFGTKLIYHVFS